MKYALAACLAVSLFLLSGCNSSDSNTTTQKTATFLHNVTYAGQIYHDGDERPYGSIDYGAFGNGVVLDVGSWDLQAKDVSDEDNTVTTTLLQTNFTVYDQGRANIYVLSGSQAKKSVKLHYLKSALDVESSSYTSDSNADDSVIYINVANVHPDYSSLQIYVLHDGEEVAASDPVDTLGYGDYSADFKLTSSSSGLWLWIKIPLMFCLIPVSVR